MSFVKVKEIVSLPAVEGLCDSKLEERAKREEFKKTVEGFCKDLEGHPAELLVKAIGWYLVTECRVEDLTMANVIKLVCCDAHCGSVVEDKGLSSLGIIINDLSKKTPHHVAVKYYADYQKAMRG